MPCHSADTFLTFSQISEGLSFLHGSVKMVHGNLCPETVIINKLGMWKLSGFDMCVPNTSTSAEVGMIGLGRPS